MGNEMARLKVDGAFRAMDSLSVPTPFCCDCASNKGTGSSITAMSVTQKQQDEKIEKKGIIKAQTPDPDPFDGWTKDEQDVLIKVLQENPNIRRDPVLRDRLLSRVKRFQLPRKTVAECEVCLRHVEKNRIAYFKVNKPSNKSEMCATVHESQLFVPVSSPATIEPAKQFSIFG
jgi:hypothetical protein